MLHLINLNQYGKERSKELQGKTDRIFKVYDYKGALYNYDEHDKVGVFQFI